MVRERIGAPNWYSGTGFQRTLFRLNFFKARSSPQGGLLQVTRSYAIPHPDESQEFWKRDQKTKELQKFFQAYTKMMNLSSSAINYKIKEAFEERKWIPEMEMMKAAPPTRLQINWQRHRYAPFINSTSSANCIVLQNVSQLSSWTILQMRCFNKC